MRSAGIQWRLTDGEGSPSFEFVCGLLFAGLIPLQAAQQPELDAEYRMMHRPINPCIEQNPSFVFPLVTESSETVHHKSRESSADRIAAHFFPSFGPNLATPAPTRKVSRFAE